MDQWIAVGILVLVMVMLISNRVRLDIVGMVALALVALFHLVPSKELFAGFSSYAAIILAEMFALGEGLRRAGFTDKMATLLEKIAKRGENSLASALLIIPPIPSTFISDVGLMSIFLPTMTRIRQDLQISLHRLLLPLSVSIALGGLLSMIGSAGNIIGNSQLASSNIAPLGIFAITPLGILLVAGGFVFMRFWAIKHLPQEKEQSEFLTDYQQVKEFMTEIRVKPGSELIGQSLREIPYFRQHQVTVVRIFHPEGMVISPGPTDVLELGDRLLVQGSKEAVLTLGDDKGLEVLTKDSKTRLREGGARVVEAIVPHRSILTNRTLKETNFRTRYGLTVLAVLRQGITKMDVLPDLKLLQGDVLLVQGTARAISRAELSSDLTVLLTEDDEDKVAATPLKAWVAGITMIGVLLSAALNFLNIEVAAIVGLLVMVGFKVMTTGQIYRAIDWRIIVLVGGITPLSTALIKTGVTAGVAHNMVSLLGSFGPVAILAGFFWIAAILTQVVSNVAAALILSPIAISVATSNHWSAYPFIISMIVALSAAPITPLANKVFLMAMGPGKYRYQDFFKIGVPLTLFMFAITIVAAPIFFPFK